MFRPFFLGHLQRSNYNNFFSIVSIFLRAYLFYYYNYLLIFKVGYPTEIIGF